MRKLFALLFVAGAMTFTSCGNSGEQTATEGTTDTAATTEAPVVVEDTAAPAQVDTAAGTAVDTAKVAH